MARPVRLARPDTIRPTLRRSAGSRKHDSSHLNGWYSVKRFRRWTLAALMLSTAGCNGNPAVTTAVAPARLIVGDNVACDDASCKQDWERAQLWLAKHSLLKLQTSTDVLLQTYNPSQYSPTYTFSVTREPVGSSQYRIAMDLSCGNPLGCNPNPVDVRTAFLYYVKTGQDVLVGVAGMMAIR